ncbi:MAG: transcription elongation factor GreA [Mycoplasmataceae bacterium]|jgi:transcription elongation factor GreA|nr:transcription elongation factor GreA [Mycoplasmataceae bacterium]
MALEITKEKLDELKNELDNLITVQRPKVIVELQQAREQGDLSENADYDAAKEHQADIENRIKVIQTILNDHSIIKNANSHIIKIGSKVTYKNTKTGKNVEVEIVGVTETDPKVNKISNECPIAKAILGHSEGDKVQVINIEIPYFIEIIKVS